MPSQRLNHKLTILVAVCWLRLSGVTMISGPVAVRPDIPGRRASSSRLGLKTSDILGRRATRACWCALSLYLSFVIVSTAGEKGKDTVQPLNFFVDVSSSRLAEEVDIDR